MSTAQSLAVMTITAPAQAARAILAQSWQRQVLWTGLVLAIVLNAIIYTLQEMLFPLPAGVVLPRLSPGSYFVVMLVLQVVFIYALFTAGRWVGGQARIEELMALVVWLQLLQVGLQAAMTILFLAAPLLAGLFNLVATLFGFFILLHFINEAHQLRSIWRSLGVLLMASITIALALSFLLGLIGPSLLGHAANV